MMDEKWSLLMLVMCGGYLALLFTAVVHLQFESIFYSQWNVCYVLAGSLFPL